MVSPRIPAALLGAAVLAMAGCVWLVGKTQRTAADASFQQAEAAQEMLSARLDEETGLRGYLLNGGRAEFLQPYRIGTREFAAALATSRRLAGDDDEVQSLLDRSEQLRAEWHQLAEVALRRGPARTPLPDAIERKRLMDGFRTVNADLRQRLAGARSSELSRATSISVVIILGLSALFAAAGWLLVGRPMASQRRRETRRAEQRERQTSFARALQMADNEEEAHALVKRHLERSIDGADVTVLYRNASGDRLAATTPVDEASPLGEALVEAHPRSCLAVRRGGGHEEGAADGSLMECTLCGKTGRERSMCSPLLVSGEVIGAVQLAHDAPLGSEHRAQVDDAVTMAAPVIANLRNLALAEQRAATDALTGLANRRALQDTLKRMTAQATRARTSLAAIALDIDHFKQINDRHGHERGDHVLAAVSQALSSTLRASDFLARSGGEEFLVLLPDTGLDGAMVVAENLRAALQAMAIPGLAGPVTGSFGVAVHPEDSDDADGLLRRADRALYLAKRNGRNRVEAAASSGVS